MLIVGSSVLSGTRRVGNAWWGGDVLSRTPPWCTDTPTLGSHSPVHPPVLPKRRRKGPPPEFETMDELPAVHHPQTCRILLQYYRSQMQRKLPDVEKPVLVSTDVIQTVQLHDAISKKRQCGPVDFGGGKFGGTGVG